MKIQITFTFLASIVAVTSVLQTGCARRMVVSTGTTIGLHATPGDGKSQTPQVTLAYKRAELALVPTGEKAARKSPAGNSDSYSALAIVDFRTKWFSGTGIDLFIATGHASRDIQEQGSEFTAELLHVAKTDSSKRLQAWVNSAADATERKRRQQAMTDWIGGAGYTFAHLLYRPDLEKERQKFLTEKAAALSIP